MLRTLLLYVVRPSSGGSIGNHLWAGGDSDDDTIDYDELDDENLAGDDRLHDLRAFALTCKCIAEAARDESVWRALLRETWPVSALLPGVQDWRHLYRIRNGIDPQCGGTDHDLRSPDTLTLLLSIRPVDEEDRTKLARLRGPHAQVLPPPEQSDSESEDDAEDEDAPTKSLKESQRVAKSLITRDGTLHLALPYATNSHISCGCGRMIWEVPELSEVHCCPECRPFVAFAGLWCTSRQALVYISRSGSDFTDEEVGKTESEEREGFSLVLRSILELADPFERFSEVAGASFLAELGFDFPTGEVDFMFCRCEQMDGSTGKTIRIGPDNISPMLSFLEWVSVSDS